MFLSQCSQRPLPRPRRRLRLRLLRRRRDRLRLRLRLRLRRRLRRDRQCYVVLLCPTVAWFVNVSDSAMLCHCVQQWHGVFICPTALGFVTVSDSAMICRCVRLRLRSLAVSYSAYILLLYQTALTICVK